MGMGTQGNTPNPGERPAHANQDKDSLQAPGNADPDPRVVPDEPKAEMQPQDGTDRSHNLERVRAELKRTFPHLAEVFEHRPEAKAVETPEDVPARQADEARDEDVAAADVPADDAPLEHVDAPVVVDEPKAPEAE